MFHGSNYTFDYPLVVDVFKLPKGKVEASAYLPFTDNNTWQAIRLILRAGDDITLSAGENGNQYVKEAGLHSDEMYLSVNRKGKHILISYPVAQSTCPNNSARMIQ